MSTKQLTDEQKATLDEMYAEFKRAHQHLEAATTALAQPHMIRIANKHMGIWLYAMTAQNNALFAINQTEEELSGDDATGL